MARPLRVGVQLPEVEWSPSFADYAAMARAAEEVGFDSVWLGDHLLYRGDGREERGPWDAWVLLSALAAVTERVSLGPLVACTAFHPPGILARMAAALTEVSGGRFVLGLGAGWNETEFRAFGLPFDHRVSRFEEAFEIIRRLLGGEHVTLGGRFHQAEDAVLLPAPSQPTPLMVGSIGPRMLELTLPHVQSWNAWADWYGNRAEGLAALQQQVDETAERLGRDPREIERSACLVVELDRQAPGQRPHSGVEPVSLDRAADELRALAEAGADEAILVLRPIDETSIRALGAVLSTLD